MSKRKCEQNQIIPGLSNEAVDEICELYQTGRYAMKLLGEKYHCSTYLIKQALKKKGVPIHARPLHYKDIDLRDDYFSVIDTEAKAYFLGFLFADGNVYKDMITLEIHFRDVELLQKFREEVRTVNKLSYRKSDNTEMVALRVNSLQMTADLAKYGIIPDKTHKTKHLITEGIPKELLKHFVRGLLDGDGWISKDKNGRLHVGFVTNYASTAQDFQDLCNSLIKTPSKARVMQKSKTKHGGYVSQFFAQESAKQLVTVLYKDSTICLTRKFSRAEEFFEYNDDEDIV